MAKDKTPPDAANDAVSHPTPDEGRAMLADDPAISAVLTTEGWLSRDGSLIRLQAS